MRPFVVRKFNCGQTMRSIDKTLCSLIMLISRAYKGLHASSFVFNQFVYSSYSANFIS